MGEIINFAMHRTVRRKSDMLVPVTYNRFYRSMNPPIELTIGSIQLSCESRIEQLKKICAALEAVLPKFPEVPRSVERRQEELFLRKFGKEGVYARLEWATALNVSLNLTFYCVLVRIARKFLNEETDYNIE